jgi:mono/diheme cytochrome c family protein/glucose/arabinose dehydrogenase
MVNARVLFAVPAIAASLAAQAGDRKDPPGTVQAQLPSHWQIPPAPARSPEEELATFTVEPGLRVELVASEPLVEDPVVALFDAHARLWVVEMRGFMPDIDAKGEDAPVGRIVVLRDTDGDGRMDVRTVYREGLVLPRAVLPLDDHHALVIAAPSFFLCTDADGDLIAETIEPIGIDYPNATSDPEHAANSPIRWFDGWIHLARFDRKLWWDGRSFRTAAVTMAGQWGLSFDDGGSFYHDNNSDHLRAHAEDPTFGAGLSIPGGLAFLNQRVVDDQSVYPGRITPGVNRGYQKGTLRGDGTLARFTAACAPFVYRGRWLASQSGSVFVAEPAANLVRRVELHPEGARMRGRNALDETEFLTSTDERFRPVNFTDGPDDALYVVDMYRGVLQHRNYVTTWLRRQVEDRGLEQPIHRGRIWRVRPERSTPRPLEPSATRSNAALLGDLAADHGWRRDRAREVLASRGDLTVVPALREQLLTGTDPVAIVASLAVLGGLDRIDLDVLSAALRHESALVRRHAVRWSQPFLAAGRPLALGLIDRVLATERDPLVALGAVLASRKLGDLHLATRRDDLLGVLLRFAEDAAIRDALLLHCIDDEAAWLTAISAMPADSGESPAVIALLRRVADVAPRGRRGHAIAALYRHAIAEVSALRRESILAALAAAMPKSGQKPIELATLLPEPPTALLAREPRLQPHFARIREGVALRSAPTPSARTAESHSGGAALYAAHCASCHLPDGVGMAGLAPPLRGSEWVLGDPERLLSVILRGLSGPIEVAGQSYEFPLMPDHAKLADTEIAAIASWLRQAFDHSAGPVDAAAVARVRAATASRTQPFRAEDFERR